MKTGIQYAYNVLRNLSLFLVLLVLSSFLISKYDLQISGFVGHYFVSPEVGLLQENDSEIQTFNTAYKPSKRLKEVETKRFKIKIPKGNAYLQPNDIMYINYHSDSTILKTSNFEELIIKPTLKSLQAQFDKHCSDQFFKTQKSIINCSYIQESFKLNPDYLPAYKYTYHVKMTDGEVITISEKAHSNLLKLLDKKIF